MYVCMNRTTSKVRMYEQDYYRVCKKRTTSSVCKNKTTSKVRMYEQGHVRTRPQVEDVITGLLVRYICMNMTTSRLYKNRTTSRGCRSRTTSKVRMYEQDY